MRNDTIIRPSLGKRGPAVSGVEVRDAVTLADISINDWAEGTTISGGEVQEQR